MNVFFDMVGCRLNQAEIDLLAMKSIAEGNTLAKDAGKADCIFINTCCVTKKAAADSRKMVRKYQRDTHAKVIAMGCWPSGMPEDALSVLDSADIINNDAKFCLLDYSKLNVDAILEKPQLGERQRTRAFVKVQDGCFNQCAFCLTTIARGLPRSANLQEIIRYIQKLESLGTKEIVLTGVQLGSWGADLTPDKRLSELVQTILKVTHIPRIRLSSIEPWDVTNDLLELFQDTRLCSHLHIPIQSASDEVLKRMQRQSTRADLVILFNNIHRMVPELSITSDILVGFPGEQEKDFEDTKSFIQDIGLNGGHVFSYSPMPGTVAAEMDHQIQQSVAKDRNKIIRTILSELESAYKQKRVNTTDEVLFESGLRIDNTTYWSGLSKDMLRVLVPGELSLKNSIHRVKLDYTDKEGRLFAKLLTA